MRATDADPLRAAQEPLEVVEFDGHRLDVRLKIVVRDPLGFEQSFEIERVWLLVILDVFSRAVLGYHVSVGREYSRYDVIRAIEHAIEPHRPMRFTLPGVGYGAAGGFPSEKYPELGFAIWQRIKLDRARANLAADVQHALTEFLGCTVEIGPPRQPDERPYIERFFGTIATNLSSRLPGYTGSHPRDLRKALSAAGGNLRLYVSLDELEELLEAALGAYNATPHSGLNGLTPLEAMAHGARDPSVWLNWLPQAKQKTLALMQTPRRATVRGYLAQGQRGHVNFHGVRYTNAALAGVGSLIGTELRLYYNSYDLRTVRAFGADGTDLGELRAQGAWGIVAHDLKLRQEILRQQGKRRMASNLTLEFLDRFVEQKVKGARAGRRAASDLARTLRTMKPKRPAASVAPPSSAEKAQLPAVAVAPVPLPVADRLRPAAAATKVKPQLLSVGTGFIDDDLLLPGSRSA
jgi:transposase InsO family protein